jgi:hypothetical protein
MFLRSQDRGKIFAIVRTQFDTTASLKLLRLREIRITVLPVAQYHQIAEVFDELFEHDDPLLYVSAPPGHTTDSVSKQSARLWPPFRIYDQANRDTPRTLFVRIGIASSYRAVIQDKHVEPLKSILENALDHPIEVKPGEEEAAKVDRRTWHIYK